MSRISFKTQNINKNSCNFFLHSKRKNSAKTNGSTVKKIVEKCGKLGIKFMKKINRFKKVCTKA